MSSSYTVTPVLSPLVVINIRRKNYLGIQARHMSGSALNGFRVRARVDSNADWFTIASASNEYTQPVTSSLIRYSSGDPTILTPAVSCTIGMESLGSMAEVEVAASTISGSAIVEIIAYSE